MRADFDIDLPQYKIFKLHGGRNIAFLGLNTGEPSLYRDGAFNGAAKKITAIHQAAQDLSEKIMETHRHDIDCIIPLTHQDVAEDIKLAEGRFGYPVILGGHDHSVFMEKHNNCHICKAGEDAKNVIVIDMFWPAGSPRGFPSVTEVNIIPLCEQKGINFRPNFQPDEHMLSLVERWSAPAKELELATLATFPPSLDDTENSCVLSSVGVRIAPSTMATLIATALRDVCKADGALINAGGVRGKRHYQDGKLTYAHLSSECPFPSSNVVIRIDGETLNKAIQSSRSTWIENPGEEDADALHTDEGMIFDSSHHELLEVKRQPICPQKLYEVVCGKNSLS